MAKKKEEKRPEGRPTKYLPEYCVLIIEYFTTTPMNDFPTLYGFASTIGVHRHTIQNWGEQYPEFLDAIKKAERVRDDKIDRMCMTNNWNTTYGIWWDKTRRGMIETSRTEHTGHGGGPLIIETNVKVHDE